MTLKAMDMKNLQKPANMAPKNVSQLVGCSPLGLKENKTNVTFTSTFILIIVMIKKEG
jgi:hypothetical protein